MRWRDGWVSDRTRYLKQQAELGGAEVVISRKATELVTMADREPAAEAPAGKVTVREVPSLKDTGVMPAAKRPGSPPAAERPAIATDAWKKGAPPIPGPGLEIEPPETYPELKTLDAVADLIRGCPKCRLCETRTNTVPGEGAPNAKFVVVGEGPGATEDELGRPFVGRAGELLDSILGSVGIAREAAHILNIVKCRPPQNRKPLPDEMAACLPYLHRQLALLRPKVILAAGGTAASGLLQSKASLGQLRGQVHRYAGIPVIATYHPAALLRNPNWKRPTWDDVRIARQLYDL
jgi:uracil-DNA glycosylase family 4